MVINCLESYAQYLNAVINFIKIYNVLKFALKGIATKLNGFYEGVNLHCYSCKNILPIIMSPEKQDTFFFVLIFNLILFTRYWMHVTVLYYTKL